MKQSELVVGATVAYTRKRDKSSLRTHDIQKVTIASNLLNYAKRVTITYPTKRWGGEEFIQTEYVALSTLVGDWDTVYNEAVIRDKNNEIARLQRQIEARRRDDLLESFKPIFIEALGVYSSSLRKGDYRGYSLDVNEEQLRSLYNILRNHNWRVAEDAKKSAEETTNA
jgi:hypothetical protein